MPWQVVDGTWKNVPDQVQISSPKNTERPPAVVTTSISDAQNTINDSKSPKSAGSSSMPRKDSGQNKRPPAPTLSNTTKKDNPQSSSNTSVKSNETPRSPTSTSGMRPAPRRPNRPADQPEEDEEVTVSRHVKSLSITTRAVKETPHEKEYFEARWAFVARNADEMEMLAGDRLVRIRQAPAAQEEGWFYGENLNTRKIGMCPMNYLKRIESPFKAPPSPKQPMPEVVLGAAPIKQNYGSVKATPQPSNTAIKVPPPPPQPTQVPLSPPTTTTTSPRSAVQAPPPPPPPPKMQYRSSQGIPTQQVKQHESHQNIQRVKRSGYATDVIAVRRLDMKAIYATDFNVRFSGRSLSMMCLGDPIDVLIDGKVCFTMTLRENGTGKFNYAGLQFDPIALGAVPGLLSTIGPHTLRYEHRYEYNCETCLDYVEAYLWLWDPSDCLIVSDIDGTVTRSDAGGLINGVLGHKFGWKKGHAHEGVCSLYNALLDKLHCRILYLTARPLNLIKQTRSYIYELEQPLYSSSMTMRKLPTGPIITDTTDISGSLRREVVDKTSHEFKIEVLLQIRQCFINAGRDIRRYPVYLAAFGNKDTDVKAYKAAGVPPITIMVIDTKSNLQVADERQKMNSYHDTRVLPLLLERAELIKAGRVPDPSLSLD